MAVSSTTATGTSPFTFACGLAGLFGFALAAVVLLAATLGGFSATAPAITIQTHHVIGATVGAAAAIVFGTTACVLAAT